MTGYYFKKFCLINDRWSFLLADNRTRYLFANILKYYKKDHKGY